MIASTTDRVRALLVAEDRAWAAYEAAATSAELRSDVIIDVHMDKSHTWWVARVTYAATGRPVPCFEGEGETLPTRALAEWEGRLRAARTHHAVVAS